MEEAVLRGRIDAPGFMDDFAIRAAYLENTWVGPNPGQIDPTKETTAALDRIGGRLTTIAGESAAIGEDFDKNIDQIAYEENTMAQKKVSPVGMGARGGTGVNQGQADSDSDNDDEDENNKSKGDK